MSNIIERIKDAFELEEVQDIGVEDTADPDVVIITIKGRLKKDLNPKDVQDSDYDRAMKGLTPCTTSLNTSLKN